MQFLKADTNVEVLVGPAVAVGDGFTPVTTLHGGSNNLSGADEAEIIKYGGATALTVTSIATNTITPITGADGYYTLDLSTGNLDTEGMLSIVINDDSLILPIRHDFMVVSANVYDSLFAASGTDTLDVQVSGIDASAITATSIATGAITNAKIAAGAITSTEATSVGTAASVTAGVTLAATATSAQLVDDIWDESLSGHSTGGSAGKTLRNAGGIILHSGTADAGDATTIDLETGVASEIDDFYNHTVVIITAGSGAGQERIITDYTGSTQQATVTPAWATNPNATSEYELIPGTVHAETQGGGYAGGAVWIGPSGSTGTQLYVDGTVDNPIDDGQMANAKTVADALNLRIFRLEPTSSITLGETLNGYAIEGVEYTLNLGTQDVSNTYINGATIAASTATGSGTIYDNCIFDNAVTLSPCVIRNSYLGDATITAGSAGNFFINHCVSRAAGASVAPNFDFGAALNASNLNIRDYSGGIELENMGAGTGTYNASIDGNGQVIINANCSATANLAIRGAFTLTDNAGGAVTVSDDARLDVPKIADGVWDEAQADHVAAGSFGITATEIADILTDTADIQPNYATATALTTVDGNVDAIKVITDALTAAAAAKLALSAAGIISGATSGTPTTTASDTDLTGYADDELIGRTIIFTGGTANGQASDITDYANTSGVVTYTALATAPAASDTFVIV